MRNLPGVISPTPGQRQVVYGQVSFNKPLPTTYDEPLYVINPDYSYDIFYECEYWPKIHGATFPAAGADVLLVFDHRHNPRCVWWAGLFTPFPDPD